jgi:hypothetical protein
MVSPRFTSNPQLIVKDIFLDNHNLDVYRFQQKNELRPVEINEGEKMRSCKDSIRGFLYIIATVVMVLVLCILVVIVGYVPLAVLIISISGQSL